MYTIPLYWVMILWKPTNVTLELRGRKMSIQDDVKECNLQTNTGYEQTIKPVALPANPEINVKVQIARINKVMRYWLGHLASCLMKT